MMMNRRLAMTVFGLAAFLPTAFAAQAAPQVQVDTNMGSFVLDLNPKAAPKTVQTFLGPPWD